MALMFHAPSPFPDQLKGALFCLKEKLFQNLKHIKDVKCYPVIGDDKRNGKVPKNFLGIREKGKDRVVADFTVKLYESFPDIWYSILQNVQPS